MDLASRVQLGEESLSVFMNDGTYMVSRMLTIFNAAEDDAGNFTCEASSTIPELSLSPSDSRMFELVVLSKFKQVYVLYSCGLKHISLISTYLLLSAGLFAVTAEL